jgi:YhcH/YjgK/YiaL family protein
MLIYEDLFFTLFIFDALLKYVTMIVDKLEKSALYNGIGDRFAAAFNFLSKTNLQTIETGRYEINGSDVFALVSEYETKKIEDAKWEAHQKYADVQFIVSGEEQMGYAPLKNMTEKDTYNPEKDIVFLNGKGDYITATAGTFIVFFPHDAHQPCVSIGQGSKIKKVVVKVKI